MEIKLWLRAFLNRWWIILPVFLITVIATVIFTQRERPVYQSKATFVATLNSDNPDETSVASALDILSRRAEIASTYSEVAVSRRIKDLASENLALPPELTRLLSVSSRVLTGTNILEITVTGPDPVLVRDFTNAVGTQVIGYVQNLYATYELVPLDDAVVAGNPIRPRPMFNYMLGAAFGLALGTALAFLSIGMSTPKKDNEFDSDFDYAAYSEGGSYRASPVELQKQMAVLQSQIEATRGQLKMTSVSMKEMQKEVMDTNTTVHNLLTQLQGYYNKLLQNDRNQTGIR